MERTNRSWRKSNTSTSRIRPCAGALFVGLSAVPASALADCVSPPRGGDDALIARISQASIDAHQALYDGQKYKMLAEFGWAAPDRAEEFTSHFFATLLINHGVVSDDPPIWQNPQTGDFEYDPNGLSWSKTFHRSWDGYRLLGLDSHAVSCQDVYPLTGECYVNPGRRDLFSSSIENFGVDLGTGVIDMIPNSPGTTARFVPIHDLFKDPDHLIEYSCGALDDSHGLVAMARTIIHENWHSTAAPKHVDGASTPNYNGPATTCSLGQGRCDTFVWVVTTSARMFGGLSHQQFEGVGAYQLDQEFMCDLVESPADWIPLQTRAVAQAHFDRRSNQRRFSNVPAGALPGSPAGVLPMDCGEPLSILTVASDGSVLCSNNEPCQADADCSDGDPLTTDMCGPSSCCEYNPVCSNGESCQVNSDCDDGSTVTVDSCSANGCCLYEPVT